jgi:hypothetical protein
MIRNHFRAIEKFFSSQFTNIVFIQETKFMSKFTNTSNDIKDVLSLSLLNDS